MNLTDRSSNPDAAVKLGINGFGRIGRQVLGLLLGEPGARAEDKRATLPDSFRVVCACRFSQWTRFRCVCPTPGASA